jgi:catechol 2,3-dioxygenase-like lactoylglutathione lyase family enzyme
MLFSKVGAVIIQVSDMKKSLKFYKETLGLPLKTQSEDWTEFFNSGTVIALHRANNKEQVNSGKGMLLGFTVYDFETVVKNLKENKVIFLKEPTEESFGKHTVIKDPDDHLISIAQIKRKPTEDEFDLFGLLGAE